MKISNTYLHKVLFLFLYISSANAFVQSLRLKSSLHIKNKVDDDALKLSKPIYMVKFPEIYKKTVPLLKELAKNISIGLDNMPKAAGRAFNRIKPLKIGDLSDSIQEKFKQLGLMLKKMLNDFKLAKSPIFYGLEKDIKQTDLMNAIEKGDNQGIEELLKQRPPLNIKNKEGDTALIMACKKDNLYEVQMLTNGVAFPKVLKDFALNNIAELTVKLRLNDCLQLLTNNNAVNLQNESGMTALMYAAQKGSNEIACLLLDIGANVNIIDKNGMTALMHAAQKGIKQTVQLLIDKDAKNIKDKKGHSAADYAKAQGHKDIAVLLEKMADSESVFAPEKLKSHFFFSLGVSVEIFVTKSIISFLTTELKAFASVIAGFFILDIIIDAPKGLIYKTINDVFFTQENQDDCTAEVLGNDE